MRVETVPELVATFVLENVAVAKRFAACYTAELPRDGKRVVDGAEGVCEHVELSGGKLRRDVVRETRTEEREVLGVVDLERRFGRCHFGEKLHALNIGKDGLWPRLFVFVLRKKHIFL